MMLASNPREGEVTRTPGPNRVKISVRAIGFGKGRLKHLLSRALVSQALGI